MKMLRQTYIHSSELSNGFSGHDHDGGICSYVILNILLNHPVPQSPHL